MLYISYLYLKCTQIEIENCQYWILSPVFPRTVRFLVSFGPTGKMLDIQNHQKLTKRENFGNGVYPIIAGMSLVLGLNSGLHAGKTSALPSEPSL